MNILSLFDGMACGMLAMLRAGVKVDSYFAYEIDKYAVQTATHNFPKIVECGDVFQADFTKYHDIDFIVGGSPCTYWSIVQKNGRETTASGIGWELFSQYVRALQTVKPQYFIYENNKSMSNAIRESISETFGFEPICINSALVSAQNRQRLYWVGCRNEGGYYDKVNVQQPKDRGILLRDILDSAEDLTSKDKSWALTASYDGACAWNTIERSQRNMCVEPVGTTTDNKAFCLTSYYSTGQNAPHTLEKHIGSMVDVPVGETKDSKSYCLTAGYSNGSGENIGNYAAHTLDKGCKSMVAEPVNTTENGKSQTIKAQSQKTSIANIVKYKSTYGASGVAEPVCVAQRGRYADTGNRSRKTSAPIQQYYEPRQDGKTNTLTTVQKDNAVCETVRVGSMPRPNGELSQSQGLRVYSADGKSVNLLGNAGGAGAKTGLYAIPVEFENGIPTKAISNSDGKTYTVYRVANGIIRIKDKEYPIKLQDGFYIIRKLSVSECKRLQTVPEWYEFKWRETAVQYFGNEVYLCKNVKLKNAISQLQTKKLAYATNIICGSLETELRSLVENMLITIKIAKKMGATESAKHYRVTASSIIKNGSNSNQSIKQKSALCVTNQLGIEAVTECALSIIINGSEQEMLYITKKDNFNLMEMLGVSITKQMTEDGFIELLQKKFSAENSLREKLFIISILTNWIIARTIYMFATTKFISVCIDSLNEWQHHCLKMELLSLKTENIGGMSDSAAYKMLGNGWTVDVIAHLIKACLEPDTEFVPKQLSFF